MLTDVAGGNRAEQGICDCVRQHVCVRMSFKSVRVCNLDSTEDQLSSFRKTMRVIADSTSNHWSELQIDYAIRGDNAVFVFHILTRTKIDSSAGGFNQEPSCGDIPKADS